MVVPTLTMSSLLAHQILSKSRPRRLTTLILCLDKGGPSPNLPGNGRKPVAVKATSSAKCATSVVEPKTHRVVDLDVLANVDVVLSHWMKFITKVQRALRFDVQLFVEKAIVDCRFFTLLAIAGSLIGSILCFIEGCVLILGSYVQYFHSFPQRIEQEHVVSLLIEAIDMYLVGFAMFVFGMALHVMFVGQQNFKLSLSTNFNLQFQKLPSWIQMESPLQAKLKIGQAVIMILLVQVLEKLKTIPVTSGIDLACFAAAVFLSSVTIFFISRTASGS